MSVILSIARPEHRDLLRSALSGILLAALAAVVVGLLIGSALGLSPFYLGKTLLLFVFGAALLLVGLAQHHPFRTLGAANLTTLARGTLVALLGGLVGDRSDGAAPAVATAVAITATLLDWLDGYLARRTKMSSDFGARFDMETDAMMILVLSILAWQFGKAGAWVLLSGFLRYIFVAAGALHAALRQPLPESFRRKTIAVVQMIALIAAVAPFVPRALSAPVAAIALGTLVWSFLLDVIWLLRRALQSAGAPSHL